MSKLASPSRPGGRCLQAGKIIGLSSHSVLISRSSKEFDIDDTAAPIRSADGKIQGVVVVFHDVTEARRLERQMAHDAAHDTLTGLVNAANSRCASSAPWPAPKSAITTRVVLHGFGSVQDH